MNFPTRILRVFFSLLYHEFAWTYDLVATIVSLGMWKDWVFTVLPFLEGPHILELGHGPGHLQARLSGVGYKVAGLDESFSMNRIASRRLARLGFPTSLVNGRSQDIPFATGTFQQVTATFPSEYIFDPQTLGEIYRVLSPGGKMVTLPLAWITGKRWSEKAVAWLYRVTGQVGNWEDRYVELFQQSGFVPTVEYIPYKSSVLLLIQACKPFERQ